MQGSYKNNGLPRPYYMKPSKRGSAYDKMPKQVFLTNSRKLTGYVIMLFLFCLCVFLVSQELKTPSETDYELVGSNRKSSTGKNSGDVGTLVDSAKAGDHEDDKADLAMNKIQNSKGEYGRAVMEAPKGGMVNEAHIVGNDEDLLVDGKTKKTASGDATGAQGKGFKATREDGVAAKQPALLKAKEVEGQRKDSVDSQANSNQKPKLKNSGDVQKILEESDKH